MLKKLWNKVHWSFKFGFTFFAGAISVWFMTEKNPEMNPGIEAGVNDITIIEHEADSIKADTSLN